jgi:hypothetical protein
MHSLSGLEYVVLLGLTLIEPGEVKVDLADFDLKLQENFISTSHFFLTYSCRNVFRIFLNI